MFSIYWLQMWTCSIIKMFCLDLKKYDGIFLSCSLLSHSQHVRSFLCLWGSGPFLYFLMRILLNSACFSDLSESKDWFFFPFIPPSTQKQDQSYLNSNTWDQESVTFFCRESNRNCVWLCCPYDPHCNYSTLFFLCKIVIDNTLTNGCGCWRGWQYTIQTLPLWHFDYF